MVTKSVAGKEDQCTANDPDDGPDAPVTPRRARPVTRPHRAPDPVGGRLSSWCSSAALSIQP